MQRSADLGRSLRTVVFGRLGHVRATDPAVRVVRLVAGADNSEG
jgi:hypothetical protein